MVRQIFLYGPIGQEFGEFHQLDVHSVAEACRALGYQCKGFLSRVKDGTFEIIDGPLTDGKPIATNELDVPLQSSQLHIVPIIEGSGGGGGKGIITAVVGVALVAAAIAIPALSPALTMGSSIFGSFTFTNLAVMGGILAIAGITNALSTVPETNYATVDESEASASSFLFNGAPQRYEQGGALPIIVGRHMAGPITVSASIKTNQIVVSGGTDSGDNSGTIYDLNTYSWRASISPSGTIKVPAGSTAVFTFGPAEQGITIQTVYVDDVEQLPIPSSYTFTNVQANHSLRVICY